jgi:hypothetical protein
MIRYLWQNKLILLTVIVGSMLTLLPILFDGQSGCIHNQCGFIIGTNYRDGIWFQAVSATAFNSLPFRMPNFSGALLSGYHFLPNLVVNLLSRIGIPIPVTYYKLFPILYFTLLIYLSISYARKIKNHPLFVEIFLFFVLFGIPLTLITSLHYYGFIKNSLLINTFQSTRILESIHFAFSFIILLFVLIMLNKRPLRLRQKLLIGFFVFLIFGIKFYVAVIILFMLVMYETFSLFRNKKLGDYLIAIVIYGISSLISIFLFYNPFAAAKSGSIFVFAPFATVHHLIENEALFYLPNMVLARYYLYAHGMSPRLIAIELFSTFLFVVFYFGTRVLGFIYIAKQIVTKKISQFEVTLTFGVLLGIILSVSFVQKGDWFNPMQFAVVSAFLMNIFAAKFLYELLRRYKTFGIVIGIIVIILTLIPNLINLKYLSDPARYVIPQEEVIALNELKKMPDGPVFTPIIDPDMTYVSALTGKQTYINFTTLLDTTGIDYKNRLEQTKDPEKIEVDNLEIKYVYIPKNYKDYEIISEKFKKSKHYKQILQNTRVIIFEKI